MPKTLVLDTEDLHLLLEALNIRGFENDLQADEQVRRTQLSNRILALIEEAQ